ncbi:MAG: methionyl-tRNA formyltransferase [Rhodobacteraceae bacterium]|nr:methionyl-tRNA formyltransferase [Paracoccaceae bacterium]MCY4250440.1 methionyl-tRNA formyltransferase [Paracoccaceae bacterium]
MKLIVMGQQAFGKAALEKILADGVDEVVAVYCAPDKPNRPMDPLKETALEKGIAVCQPANYRDSDTLDQMRSLNADLMIMAYVTLFVPEEARDIPEKGSICFHPSLLPLHRGPSSINWPIIWGSEKTGFSWFYPTDGLDEGDILMQWECPIGPDDTLGDVYFKKIFPAAIDSVSNVCNLFREGNPPRSTQDESKATYESWCKKNDAEIDWNESVQIVYNLIRGTNPQPGAWTTRDGKELKIFDAELVENAKGEIGEIVEINNNGFIVMANGGGILIKRVRPDGNGKISAGDWLKDSGVSVGAILGN